MKKRRSITNDNVARGVGSLRGVASASAFMCCLLLLGCGSKPKYEQPNTVKLSGSLTDGGEILTVEGRENGTGMILVGFHRIVDGKPIEQSTSASVNEEGKFEVFDGIEPGEYLITVRQWQPYDSDDLLKGRFSPRNSKIRCTIEGDTELALDLANPDG
jgi:hypothetical protein